MVKEKIIDFVKAVDCDIYLYSGDISPQGADQIVSKIISREEKRGCASLLLSTYGGDPAAAYRIARALKGTYGSFSLYVFGTCKSAGTLIAIGANEIIMTEFGELGPLDIQMPRVDELDSESGLVYSQALAAIKAHAFGFFESCYLDLKMKSGGNISTKTASSIASELSIGLFSPLAGQIDPLKVGEATRALEVTYAYGSRLTDNESALNKLINDYPSHGFVIDYEEAKDLFGNVRLPVLEEIQSIGQFSGVLRHPHDDLFVAIIDDFLDDKSIGNQEGEAYEGSQQSSEGIDPDPVQEDAGDSSEKQSEGIVSPSADRTSEEGDHKTEPQPEGISSEVTHIP